MAVIAHGTKRKVEATYYAAYSDFITEFRTESDRAAVILGTARLDLALYHLLQHALLPNTGRNDDLLEGDSPLSTFSARINACFRLGLIDAEVTRSLHLIRKIRNVFAHEASGANLNSGSHRDRVRELAVPFLKSKTYTRDRDKYFPMFEGASRDFRAIISIMVVRLDNGVDYQEPLTDKNSVTLLPPSFINPKSRRGRSSDKNIKKGEVNTKKSAK